MKKTILQLIQKSKKFKEMIKKTYYLIILFLLMKTQIKKKIISPKNPRNLQVKILLKNKNLIQEIQALLNQIMLIKIKEFKMQKEEEIHKNIQK